MFSSASTGAPAATVPTSGSPYASPVDVGPAAARHPDMSFVIYHSGFEAGGTEGPYNDASAHMGINRLISSMRGAGIFADDHVVVRPQDTAANGEIVVALLGDEATVKRFFREKDHVRLQPENKAMKPIRTEDAQILGRVIGVFRRVS